MSKAAVITVCILLLTVALSANPRYIYDSALWGTSAEGKLVYVQGVTIECSHFGERLTAELVSEAAKNAMSRLHADELTDPAKFEELFVRAFTEEMQKAGVAVKAVRIEQYDAEPIM